MASANQRKATFISNKLKLLKDQGDDLISAVGHYVNKITAAGDSWTQGGDNNMDYQELCQKIDNAVEFLCEKCEELSDLTSQSITAAAFSPATSDRQAAASLASTAITSHRQPSVPLASTATTSHRPPVAPRPSTATTPYRPPVAPRPSTATTSYRQSTESVQTADETQLKPVLDRIANIEKAMCSLRSRTDKVAEQQSGIDQQLKEVLSKLSESDKKHSSSLEQVKHQISDISETQEAIEQEQKTRLQSLEKQLQKISTAPNRQKGEMESQAELVKKPVHVPNLLETMKDKINGLDARIDGIIDDCRNKREYTETVTRDLANKVMDNIQRVQVLSEGHGKMTALLKKLETRLQKLKAGGGRNVKDVQKQAEKGEANFRILCQMLNDRLRPLERLRTCLNERASMRDYNVTKLSQLIQEVAVMSPRLQQLEVKSSRTRCGFSAETWFTEDGLYAAIRPYKTIYCNIGENFDADSGIFTAPVDGLYVVSISLYLSENEHLHVSVQYKQSIDQVSSTTVCWSSAVTKDTTACDVGVVDMKAGDVLCSFVNYTMMNNYNKRVSFSCFLLG